MDTQQRTVPAFHGCVIIFLLIFFNVIFVNTQESNQYYGSRDFNRDGVYVPSGVNGRHTYIYKDRKYAYEPNGYLDPVDRGRRPEDKYKFNVSIFNLPIII